MASHAPNSVEQAEGAAAAAAASAARLCTAAHDGDAGGLSACLAAGADANTRHPDRRDTALHIAAECRRAQCVSLLLAAGADANGAVEGGVWCGCTPLHMAAFQGDTDCIQLLLAAGANPLAESSVPRWTPLDYAVVRNSIAAAAVLLQAAPAAALHRDAANATALELALRHRQGAAVAALLLEQGPVQPAGEVLRVLGWLEPSRQSQHHRLYAVLAARQPLTAEEWGLVPSPCTGLGAALPAVLGRSAEEAAFLAQRLPAAQQEGLRTAALCLARAPQHGHIYLPAPIVWRILALSAA